jgi:hypothetical protein
VRVLDEALASLEDLQTMLASICLVLKRHCDISLGLGGMSRRRRGCPPS